VQAIFAETLVDSKDEFLQKYLVDYDFLRYEDFAAFCM
jgi:histone acetyltransferase 1